MMSIKSVHPHVCGEHNTFNPKVFDTAGSSPRVWGTSMCVVGLLRFRRFIPTCVGNIVQVSGNKDEATVHPHVCGEHNDGEQADETIDGSSPRVWGTSTAILQKDYGDRFIPTCVGNIRFSSSTVFLKSVHPHVCGEHSFSLRDCAGCCGSSPRVWGTSNRIKIGSYCLRFIPTCVGNIWYPYGCAGANSVHPHVCGEHSWMADSRLMFSGSSPRVWGTYLDPLTHCTHARFIPTCVGNIDYQDEPALLAAVHPHVCGEHYVQN